MSHCIAEQTEVNVASVSVGDTRNSSDHTESSVKRKRVRALVAVSQLFAHQSNSPPRSA